MVRRRESESRKRRSKSLTSSMKVNANQGASGRKALTVGESRATARATSERSPKTLRLSSRLLSSWPALRFWERRRARAEYWVMRFRAGRGSAGIVWLSLSRVVWGELSRDGQGGIRFFG